MERKTKKYSSYPEFIIAATELTKYQTIHNTIRKDYLELLNITEKHRYEEGQFNALYRASLKSLFSLIEADIYGLNMLDKYPNYKDKDSFEVKFKNTFVQVSNTWDKIEIQKTYFDSKMKELKELKKKRDELIHPKKLEHVHIASDVEFKKLKKVFSDYDTFINTLMSNFFIGFNPKV